MNEAKQYLKQYRAVLWEIRRLEEEVEQMRSLAQGLGSANFVEVLNPRTGRTESAVMDRVQTSSKADAADIIAKVIDTEEKLAQRRAYALRLLMEIEEVVGKVEDPTERRLLHLRYIQGEKWERIAEDLGRTERWVYRLHGRALKAVFEILSTEELT